MYCTRRYGYAKKAAAGAIPTGYEGDSYIPCIICSRLCTSNLVRCFSPEDGVVLLCIEHGTKRNRAGRGIRRRENGLEEEQPEAQACRRSPGAGARAGAGGRPPTDRGGVGGLERAGVGC